MTSEKDNQEKKQSIGGAKDRFWNPRFWSGFSASGWFSLLARNRFAIGPSRLVMAAILSWMSLSNAAWWALQAVRFGRRSEHTKLKDDPIFIVGHWRSGTTLLHELLVLDPRHTYPDTYMCFVPNHFLASSWLFRPLAGILLPARRPMDNMSFGWNQPQEDEFALCNMGIRSPYLTFVFPNRPPQDQEYLDFVGVSAQERKHWQEALLWFLKCVTLKKPGRVVLKSPPHTARLSVLKEMFPNARFIHITRDPYVIFPSTINLWRRLYRDQGLQTPKYAGLEEHVFNTFVRMYDAFERDRKEIDPSRLCEVRYEDLVKDPLGQVQAIYDQLELGDFDQARPALEAYVDSKKDYKTNRYEISPEIRREISRKWATYIERYGYLPDES